MISWLDITRDENHLEPVSIHRITDRHPAPRPSWAVRQAGRALQATGIRLVKVGQRLECPELSGGELRTA
jgi:hypothetical protein